MTQGQWKRLTGKNPSHYGPDGVWQRQWLSSGVAASLLNPVEQVSWLDCAKWLSRAGLSLPTEAQWENGARGGKHTVHWSGSDTASLQGVANLSDAYGKSHGNESWSEWEGNHDDGSTRHWQVGSQRANQNGLHDVHGNVWEWCLDACDGSFYSRGFDSDPIASAPDATHRVIRGAGFGDQAHRARSANRADCVRSVAGDYLGVRPARGVDP